MSPLRRLAKFATRTAAVAALALPWVAPAASPAGFYRFDGPLAGADAGAVTLLTNGSMAGAIPLSILHPLDGDTRNTVGPGVAVSGGSITFNPGRGAGGTAAEGYNFQYGGSFTLSGLLAGGAGPFGDLVTCDRQLNGGFLYNIGPSSGGGGASRYSFEVLFIGIASADLMTATGSTRVLNGSLTVTFDVVPGGQSLAGATAQVSFSNVAAATPEPASVVMMGMAGVVGCGVAGWRRMRGRRAA
jgi:hypothetical protein